MAEKRSATIDIIKSITNVSFTCLSAIFGAAGNVPLAGIAAFPPAALAAYETLRESILAGKHREKPLQLPLPSSSQWTESPAAWQALCTMIEQRLPDILERMNTLLNQKHGFVSQDQIRQAFIEALVEEPLHVWADTPEKRWRVGEIIATPVLAHLAHILAPVIQQIRQEHAWEDINVSRTAIEAIRDHFNPPHLTKQDLKKLNRHYCTTLHDQWKMLDFRGITHIDMNRPMSIPLVDVFIPLDALVGIPENETLERDITLDKEEHSNRRYLQNLDQDVEKELRERWEHQSARNQTIPQRTDLSSVLVKQSRLVILGDPGSGKSTLLRYLLLQRIDKSKHMQQTLPTLAKTLSQFCPVYIPLSTYATDWTMQTVGKHSLLDFIPRYLKDQNLESYTEAILTQLSQGTLLLLFDGLDEIPDIALRVQIIKAIETFTLSFPKNRFIVTSRIVGYKDAPLAAEYNTYTLADFSKEQIQSFAKKWIPAYERWVKQTAISSNTMQQETEKLFQATQRNTGVQRLAVNPLLLTILALIQRQGIDLPSHRVELYDLCATTLVDSWIKAKGAKSTSYFDKKTLFKILCPLAFWMHEHPAIGAVPEEELMNQIMKQLADRRVAKNEDEASKLAKEFLQMVRGQTGILVERGKERYGFLHLTFEEYFAAREVVVLTERDTFIRTHLHDARWHEVILLAIGTIGILQYDEKGVTKLLQETVLGAQSFFENRLHRDLILAGACLADDIGASVACEEEIIEKIVSLYLTTPYQTLRDKLVTKLDTWKNTPIAQKMMDLIIPVVLKSIQPSIQNPKNDVTERRIDRQLQADLQTYKERRIKHYQDACSYLMQLSIITILHSTNFEKKTNVELITKMLFSSYSIVRVAAAQTLGHVGQNEPCVLDALLASLSDSDTSVRRATIDSLGQLGQNEPRVLDALLASLSDSPSFIRMAVIEALGQLGQNEPRVLDALLTSLSDSDSSTCVAAAKALGQLGQNEPRVLDALLTSLLYADSNTRVAAAKALGQLGQNEPRVLDALLTSLSYTYSDAPLRATSAEALSQLGQNKLHVLDALLTSLSDYRPSVRWTVAEALGRLGQNDPRVLDALLASLSDSDSFVRRAATDSVVQLGQNDPRVLDALLASLSDSYPPPRRSAANGLGSFNQNDPRVLDALLASLSDSDSFVRRAIVEALAQTGQNDPRVLDALLASLSDSDIFVRRVATKTLAQSGKSDPQVLDALLASLSDALFPIRVAAVEALGLLDQNDPQVLNALLDTFSDPSPIVRIAVAKVLIQLGQNDPQVLNALLDALSDSDSSIRRAAAENLGQLGQDDPRVLNSLLTSLSDSVSSVRQAATEALRHLTLNSPKTANFLQNILLDSLSQQTSLSMSTQNREIDRNILKRASVLMSQFGQNEPRVTNTFLLSLSDSDSSVRAAVAGALGQLGQNGPQVIDALLVSLSDSYSSVRIAAIKALGQLGQNDPRVLSTLLASLSDFYPSIRQTAIRAISQLGQREPQVLDALLASLSDSDSSVRTAAAIALKQLGQHDSRVLDSLLTSLSNPLLCQISILTLGQLEQNKPPVLDTLLASLSNSYPSIRWAAADSLGRLGQREPQVLDALLASLSDSDSSVCRTAIRALSKFETSESRVRDALRVSLSHFDFTVRETAAEALGSIGQNDPQVLDALLVSLSDSYPTVRHAAAVSLGQLGQNEPRVIDTLLSSLSDSASSVRVAAAESLYQLGQRQTQVISTLKELLMDFDTNIQKSAASTLSKLPNLDIRDIALLIEHKLQKYETQTDQLLQAKTYTNTLLSILQQLVGEA